MNAIDPAYAGRTYVGHSLPHDSGLLHATGKAVYLDDMPEPAGQLHAALVLSPVARGAIRGVGAEAALAMPGVRAVVTAGDIPGDNAVGPIFRDEPALAPGHVSYAGEPVAMVLADSHALAHIAADAVELDIEAETPVLDPLEAHARGEYVVPPQKLKRGSSGKAIKQAPHVASGTLRIGGQDHFYLETQAALAIPGDDGGMTVWSSTQHPSEVQARAAAVLGMPASRVEVKVRRMGGGFGGKESQATIYGALAALGAAHSGRPVRLRLERDVDMAATGKRHDFIAQWKAGYRDDGRIVGLEVDLLSRAGSVADLSPAVMTRAMVHLDNCYAFENITFRGFSCRTNTVSNTAFRGFGAPQGVITIESILDDIARTLRLPPGQVREVNYYGEANGYKTPVGQVLRQCNLQAVVQAAVRDSDYGARRAEIDAWNRTQPAVRRGLAMAPVKFGIAFNIPSLNQGGALVHVYRDGSVRLNHGGTEMGQGLFIKVAQVVAETFQVPLESIHLTATNTGEVPNTSPTAASTGSDINGMAALKAATAIRSRMAKVAAREMDCRPEEVEFRDARVGHGNRSATFAEVAEMCWARRVSLSEAAHYRTKGLSWNPTTMRGNPSQYHSWGAAVVEAAVDIHTGENRILRADLVQDCGASLNPAIDRGQIEGAFVQGMGWLTCEELVWNTEGRLRTVGPSTYKIPGSRDVPEAFSVRILEDAPNEAATVFHSKAVGEPPLLLAIAGWLAIRDAIASTAAEGATIPLDAPATPEKVLLAVDAARTA